MIVFDTETTGLAAAVPVPLERQPRIIEFCAVKLDDKTLKEISHINFLIHPTQEISAEITKITGITNAMLKGKEPFAARYDEILAFFLGELWVAGHNLDFDTQLLSFDLRRIGCEFAFPWPPKRLCTVEASFRINKKRMKLGDLYEHCTGKKLEGAHRAINDVRATAECIRWMKKEGLIKL